MKRTLLTCLALVYFSLTHGQSGYNLSFRIEGLKDTTVYLGYYFGESTYVKDTARINSKGEFAFEGAETLPQGMYFLVLDKTRVFDFVVGHDQHFKLETSTKDHIQNMKVTGDNDNKLFFDNIRFNIRQHQAAEPFLKILQDSTRSDADKAEARTKFSKINDEVMAHQDKLISSYPTTVTARILKASRAVRIPDPPKRADGTVDSTFQLRWYRQHFFDNFDLTDDALLRLSKPQYQQKIYEYLDRLYIPQADTLIKAIDFVISKAKNNPETYKYAVWSLVLKYQSPEIMGLDAIYVHLYDTYFATGEMDYWASSLKSTMKQQADLYRKSLIGATGANLIMLDSKQRPRSLYDIKNKYTILYFFDPDCYVCKQETPKLVNFYKKNNKRFDAEIFAVCSDTSMAKMDKYIKDMELPGIVVNGPRSYVGSYQDLYDAMSTPTLYVLDSRKKIIAKKIPADKLEEFLTKYEEIEKLKASGKL